MGLRCKACEVRSPTLQARRDPWPRQTFLPQVMTWSRVDRHVASMETTAQSAISNSTEKSKPGGLRYAGIKWMGQAQAAVFTGSASTAALRATSGLLGFSAVATEPRGHLGCRRTGWISMSGFSTERPPAGPHSAPRAHGDNAA